MKSRWLAPATVAAMWIFALVVYPRLPDVVPSHWNVRGEVDATMAKWPGAFLTPALALGVLALFHVMPRIDPRRRNWEKFRDELHIIINVMVLFFALVEVLTLGSALGWPVNVSAVMLAGTGVMLAALGNYLPRIRSNWWMGIRTPWTLDNDRVWRATHRVGGRAFVAAGALLVVAALLPEAARMYVLVPAIGLAGLFPIVYSYVAWRREPRDPSA